MRSPSVTGFPSAVGRVIGLYLASRLLTTALLAVISVIAAGWGCGSRCEPGLRFFSGGWDATFYRRIAEDGYPTTLPVDAAGEVVPNVWAFLPVYPFLVRAVGVLGLSFDAAGIIVSLVAGALAATGLFLLVRIDGSERSALWAVALFCFGPLSFILQAAYAESLFLALLFFSLWAFRRERWWWGTGLALVAAFTRPGVLAVALALGILFVLRLRGRSRGRPFPRRTATAMVVSGLLIAVAGLAWPVIADAATGAPEAYTRTELSWWTGFVGRIGLVPLAPWFLFWGRYLGAIGVIAVLAVAAGFCWWLVRLRRRLLAAGGDPALLLGWSASYGLYLFAVFLPQQSLPRLLLPLAPLLGDPAVSGRRWLRRSLLAAGIVLQPVAIVLLWVLGYP